MEAANDHKGPEGYKAILQMLPWAWHSEESEFQG